MKGTLRHTAKKLSPGRYLYRGFQVNRVGYVDTAHPNAWEAIDADGSAFAHGGSLREVKMWIDEELNDRL